MNDLNKNEAIVFELLKKWGYEECDALDRHETTMEIANNCHLSNHEVAGYLSALVKKGLADSFVMEINGTYPKFICVK